METFYVIETRPNIKGHANMDLIVKHWPSLNKAPSYAFVEPFREVPGFLRKTAWDKDTFIRRVKYKGVTSDGQTCFLDDELNVVLVPISVPKRHIVRGVVIRGENCGGIQGVMTYGRDRFVYKSV